MNEWNWANNGYSLLIFRSKNKNNKLWFIHSLAHGVNGLLSVNHHSNSLNKSSSDSHSNSLDKSSSDSHSNSLNKSSSDSLSNSLNKSSSDSHSNSQNKSSSDSHSNSQNKSSSEINLTKLSQNMLCPPIDSNQDLDNNLKKAITSPC